MNAEANEVEQANPPRLKIEFDLDGGEVFQTSVDEPRTEEEQIKAWPAAVREAQAAGIPNERLSIQFRSLNGCDFRDMLLNRMILEGCTFEHADLRRVSMTNCNLQSCSFRGALMQDANLRGADLRGASFTEVQASRIHGVILLDELDEYAIHAYLGSTGELRIRAGCRDFDLVEAREHWEGEPERTEIFAAVQLLEVIARNRNWLLEPAVAAPDSEQG